MSGKKRKKERKIYTPNEADKREIGGKMLKVINIQTAIENGHLKTVDDILSRLKHDVSKLTQVLRLDTWVTSEDRLCLDLDETIKHSEKPAAKL